jgi:tetratricopeptide (TPR) repeat protein
MKKLFLALFILQSLSLIGQNPPEDFFKGLELIKNDAKAAKIKFLSAIKEDTSFHGSYHFLGVIYLDENKNDSAAACFKKSIFLNKENARQSREMTFVRLIDAYLYQLDFENAFNTALEAIQWHPDNHVIKQSLGDLCLWSFYIKHNGLNPEYLSRELKAEYIVNSIPEEYLILRKIRVNDHYLVFSSQKRVKIKKKHYDIISCTLSKSKEPIDVKFRINWDINTIAAGKTADTKTIYANKKLPIYERIGALLISDTDIDLENEIDKLMKE